MTTPDNELPVWTIAPNWQGGILEALEWYTNVLTPEINRAEQRRMIRMSPRRSFEVGFTVEGNERSYLANWLHRLGGSEFMLPLWHDHGQLGATAAIGATTLSVDTQWREFVDDGMALLVSSDCFTFEAVEIDTVSSSTISLVSGLTSAWPSGTTIHPLRRARFDKDDASLSWLTSRVGSGTLRFNLAQANDFDLGSSELFEYLGKPVLTTEPNWSEEINSSFLRALFEQDAVSGIPYFLDPADRAFVAQRHRFLLAGRQERFEFCQFLYRLAGRLHSLWVPTYNIDAIVSAAAVSGATALDIEKIGLELVGGPAAGREHILFTGATGHEGAQISSMGTAPSASEERLNLSGAIGQNVTAGTYLSFMDVMRLDQDRVEITHHADSEGAAECNLVFRAFDDTRDGSDLGYTLIPDASMASGGCNTGCTLPTSSFPVSVQANMPNPLPTPASTNEESFYLEVQLVFCSPTGQHTYTFDLVPAGPQVYYYRVDDSNIGDCFTDGNPITCGSLGNTIVTFDFTETITLEGYAIDAHFWYDGDTIGFELTNPHDHPVWPIPQPEPTLDYTLPLWGTPAQPTPVPLDWLARAVVVGRTGLPNWSTTIAQTFAFDLQVSIGGASASVPFQRGCFPETAYYGDGYGVAFLAGIGATNSSEHATCSTTTVAPAMGSACA